MAQAEAAWKPFKLPNGVQLKNRIVKAAMEESIGDAQNFNQPSEDLVALYRQWAHGGAGMVLSGHVMVSATAVGSPANPILAQETWSRQDEQRWRSLIRAAKENDTRFLFQINHPGRQARKGTGLPTYGASPIAVNVGPGSSAMFEVPIELSEHQIEDLVSRFAWTAKQAEQLGADGVEIHAAHGYLISSFLSPKSNVRTDKWGGSRENRARFLFGVLRAVRAATGASFIVGVKINSADFQRGGFDEKDLEWVVQQLNTMNVDFVELSGGSYESPAMMGSAKDAPKQKASTRAREAYFLEAAKGLQQIAQMPLIITGGISRRATLQTVIESSDNVLVGIGTAMGIYPDLPNRWKDGQDTSVDLAEPWFLPHSIKSVAKIAQVQSNLQRMGRGQETCATVWPTYAMVQQRLVEATQQRQYRAWVHPWLKEIEGDEKSRL